ncbi:hypothetical protein Pres01_10030 [Metapseudomonas resinovorans]|nr:hypothetical protein Pres01_10030 [Pseudomonas resinovorans]
MVVDGVSIGEGAFEEPCGQFGKLVFPGQARFDKGDWAPDCLMLAEELIQGGEAFPQMRASEGRGAGHAGEAIGNQGRRL